MIDDTLLEAEEKMEKAIEHVRDELAAIRTGRANPGMFNRVVCEYYGTMTPINQLASVAVPDSRTVTIQPWDRGAFTPVEKAILKSDLGLNPTNDGKVIRLMLPELTAERRKELTKLVRKTAEESKVAIRSIRRDAVEQVKKLKKNSEITEDELKLLEKEMQELTDKYVKEVDVESAKKEKELMEL